MILVPSECVIAAKSGCGLWFSNLTLRLACWEMQIPADLALAQGCTDSSCGARQKTVHSDWLNVECWMLLKIASRTNNLCTLKMDFENTAFFAANIKTWFFLSECFINYKVISAPIILRFYFIRWWKVLVSPQCFIDCKVSTTTQILRSRFFLAVKRPKMIEKYSCCLNTW